MAITPDDDLTPDERDAFQALPREREPSRILEERVVQALRERGVLRRGPVWGGLRLAWAGAAVAAGLALFASGFGLGQWVSARATADTLVELRRHDALQVAALVQQTGTAYVGALARLAAIADSAESQDVAQGREAAVTALHAAATELVRLAPDDPVAVQLLVGLERARTEPPGRATTLTRRVAWF